MSGILRQAVPGRLVDQESLTRTCRGCGCTDAEPCAAETPSERCFWVDGDLCSECHFQGVGGLV